MSTSEVFLLAMIIIFSVPYLAWRAVAADDMAPLVVVQILAGIALGPGVLGAAFPELHALVFRPPVVQALTGIAWWAVMLFVWVAGLELDLRATWRRRRETGVTAALALGVPLLAGALLAVLLMRWPGWMGAQAQPWQFVAGIGMACSVTALPILILFLENLGILRQPLGQRILRYASLDDVAIWGVLAVILMDWQRVGRQLAFLLVFALAALACRALMRRWAARDRWHLALTWLLLVAFAADWCGLHFMVGAFLAGATLEAEWFARKDLDQLRHLLLLVLMPVFFLSTGLRTQWGVGGLSVLGVAALLLLASVGGKLLGLHLAGRMLGWSAAEARLIGWLLQTKALIMILFVNVLLDRRIISEAAFTALLLMAVGSTVLSVPMARPALRQLDSG